VQSKTVGELTVRGGKIALARNNDELEDMLSRGWSKTPPAPGSVELNLGGELSPQTRAEAALIDARLRELSGKDLLRKIEALEARLEATLGTEPAEEQKRNKRSADAVNAARERWEKRKEAPASSSARQPTPLVPIGTTLIVTGRDVGQWNTFGVCVKPTCHEPSCSRNAWPERQRDIQIAGGYVGPDPDAARGRIAGRKYPLL
jgi:hypothetical protein